MAKGDDFLERIWHEVVNVNSKGQGTAEDFDFLEQLSQGPLKDGSHALRRLLEQGVVRDDLEKLAAFVRFEACFEVLAALDDPGLGKGRIAGICKDFLRGSPKAGQSHSRGKFVQRLWETGVFLDDDGKWLKELTAKDLGSPPFNRLLGVVQRLVQKAKRLRDIGLFLGRNRALACAKVLRRLEEAGFERGDEAQHFHEEFDSSYPPARIKKPKAKSGSTPDPTEPLWHIKPAQALAFSPDSKTLATAGASGPVRLYDLATGRQRLACQGVSAHIYEIVFSPDGKQVTAGRIRKNLSVCDAKTGKLLHQLTKRDEEISGLEHAPTGEIICSSWCGDIAVFDSKTGHALPVLKANDTDDSVDAMAVFHDGTRLATLCGGKVTVWSWPRRERLLEFKAGGWKARDITCSPDGKKLAVAEGEKGVHLFDATNGKRLGLIRVPDLYKGIAFTPASRHLVVNHHRQGQLSIWDLTKSRPICKLSLNTGVFGMQASPDGKFLAASTGRGAFVWRLPPLLQER
jgi:hypothetical protein